MVAKFSLPLVCYLLVLPASVHSQQRLLKENPPVSVWILSAHNDSLSVCVAYSIEFDRIIFTRSIDSASGFSTSLSFSVDAMDSIRGNDHHAFSEKHFAASSFAESRTKKRSAEDCLTLVLPRSVYEINVEVRDDAQKITYISGTIHKDLERPDSAGILSVIFLDSISAGKYFPFIGRDAAPFPSNISFIATTEGKHSKHYSADILGGGSRMLAAADSIRTSMQEIQAESNSDGVYFSGSEDTTSGYLVEELSTDTLDEGSYLLKIKNDHEDFTFPFQYLWLDKPMTLRNFNLALSLLKYITSDSLYSEISSGDGKEIGMKFREFWKAKDPTPATAYNELEAEYYERADYAFEHFRSLGIPNGADTDRGRTYILFGKPDNMRREFRSDGTYEIWDYPNLKRNFIFKESGRGEFKLYQTEKT